MLQQTDLCKTVSHLIRACSNYAHTHLISVIVKPTWLASYKLGPNLEREKKKTTFFLQRVAEKLFLSPLFVQHIDEVNLFLDYLRHIIQMG